VEGGEEIVAAADVTEFMREDSVQMFGRKVVCYACGQQQDGPEDAVNAGFEQRRRGKHFDRDLKG
jgi:hypothetical protein